MNKKLVLLSTDAIHHTYFINKVGLSWQRSFMRRSRVNLQLFERTDYQAWYFATLKA